jgi:5,10-methylenetetrahydromethanopterin reductase
MKFSLTLNSQIGPTAEAVKLAILAEKQGLECIWYCQDLFQRDVWVFLTATATHTKHIDLGTCIINPHTVNPAELAMHAATLDEYSNGRVRLGISVGALEFLIQLLLCVSPSIFSDDYCGGNELPLMGKYSKDGPKMRTCALIY